MSKLAVHGRVRNEILFWQRSPINATRVFSSTIGLIEGSYEHVELALHYASVLV